MAGVDKTEITNWIQQQATGLGFTAAGVAPALSPAGVANLDQWLEAGYAGTMSYLSDRREAYDHPSSVLDGVKSIVMLTLDYRTADAQPSQPGYGKVSRYAWGSEDYHDLIHGKLKRLAAAVAQQSPDTRSRGVVDTAPLMEREFAQLAGLGWVGKHTLLLDRDRGSWFFLAALLTDLELEYNTQPASEHCGTCTACLDVCPTDAFPQPYVLDASRCISYLTIEHRDAIPMDLRPGIGEWLFGCDLCQDVCPWNRRAPLSSEPSFAPSRGANPLEIAELFSLDEAGFRQRFRRTPLWRSKRRGILRNAAIVLGNHPSKAAMPALVRGLNDDEPLVRGAAAWALARYGESGRQSLEARKKIETDSEVKQEIFWALSDPPPAEANTNAPVDQRSH